MASIEHKVNVELYFGRNTEENRFKFFFLATIELCER